MDRPVLGVALWNLGTIALLEAESGRAAALHREGLERAQEIGDLLGIVMGLMGVAAVAGMQGESAKAARLYRAAEALGESAQMPLQEQDRAVYERFVFSARPPAYERTCNAAWAEGRALPLEQAVEDALEGPE